MLRSFTSKLLAAAASSTAAAAASSSPNSSNQTSTSSTAAEVNKNGPDFIGRKIRRHVPSSKLSSPFGKRSMKPLPEGSAEIKQKLVESFIGGPITATSTQTPSSATAANAASANNNKFAVVSVGNLQYKVSVGDVISAQRMGAAIGSRIALKKVLVVGGVRFTAIGRPLLANCRVIAEVEEHKRFKGILNYTHYKGRHLKKLQYSEHAVTMLRIVEVSYDPQIVGEVDRTTGILLPASQTADPTEPSPSCYFKEELPKMEANVNANQKK